MDITPYLANIDLELPADLLAAIRIGPNDRRRPLTWNSLDAGERARLLHAAPNVDHSPQGDAAAQPVVQGRHPVGVAARKLADQVYTLDREVDAAQDEIQDEDDREALAAALAAGFPFTSPIGDAAIAVESWAAHVEYLLKYPPSVLTLAADELGRDSDALVTDQKKDRQPGTVLVDDWYRGHQNGGLGGEPGRVGGCFAPTVLTALANLLREVHAGRRDGGTQRAARAFASAYRNSRKQSHR